VNTRPKLRKQEFVVTRQRSRENSNSNQHSVERQRKSLVNKFLLFKKPVQRVRIFNRSECYGLSLMRVGVCNSVRGLKSGSFAFVDGTSNNIWGQE
jgi:hypothetical protein